MSCADTLSAAEFYSWIDPSGVMVMTDDPSQIPAGMHRSPVEVHRFQDLPAYQPAAAVSISPTTDAPVTISETGPPSPVAGASASLPDILMTQPDDGIRPHYVWVPLQTPMIVGSDSVSGFWWHPGVASSIDAFKAFLRLQWQHLQQQGPWTVTLPSDSAWNSVPRSGNPFYDQVVRERHALIQRTFPVSPFSQPTGPSPKGAGLGRVSSR